MTPVIRATIPKIRTVVNPVSVVTIFDASGSMGGDKLPIAIEDIEMFLYGYSREKYWAKNKDILSRKFKTDPVIFRKNASIFTPPGLWRPAIQQISREEVSICYKSCCNYTIVSQYVVESSGAAAGILIVPQEDKTNVRLRAGGFCIDQIKCGIDHRNVWLPQEYIHKPFFDFLSEPQNEDKEIDINDPDFIWRVPDGGYIAIREPVEEETFALETRGEIRHFKNGKLRLLEKINQNLELHSENGPAQTEYDERDRPISIGYFNNGHRHRFDGPASIEWDHRLRRRREVWLYDGTTHRIGGGPAEIYYQDDVISSEIWKTNGYSHRIDGPAHINYDQHGQIKWEETRWFISGHEYEGLGKAVAKGTEAVLEYARTVVKENPRDFRDWRGQLFDLLHKAGIITEHAKLALEAIILFSR